MKTAHWTSIIGLSLAGFGYLYFNEGKAPAVSDGGDPGRAAVASEPPSDLKVIPTEPTSSVAVANHDDEPAESGPEMLTGAIEGLSAPGSSGLAKGGQPATERVYLSANEKVRIPLNRAALSAQDPIILRADHGGVLEGRASSPQVELSAGAESFTFFAGGHRGRYTVSIQQGERSETLEFWVGEESPRGLPGPSRLFSAPSTVSADS